MTTILTKLATLVAVVAVLIIAVRVAWRLFASPSAARGHLYSDDTAAPGPGPDNDLQSDAGD